MAASRFSLATVDDGEIQQQQPKEQQLQLVQEMSVIQIEDYRVKESFDRDNHEARHPSMAPRVHGNLHNPKDLCHNTRIRTSVNQ